MGVDTRSCICALVLAACGSSAQPAQRTGTPALPEPDVISLRRGPRRHIVDVCGADGPVDYVRFCVAPNPPLSPSEGWVPPTDGNAVELDGAEVSVHFGCEQFGGATWLLNLELTPFAPGCDGSHQAPLQVVAVPSPLLLGMEGLINLFGQIQHARSTEPLAIAVPAFPPGRVTGTAIERLRTLRRTLDGVRPVSLDVVEPGDRIDTIDGTFSIEVVDVAEVHGAANLVLRARAGAITMLLPGRLTRASAQALVQRVCESAEGPCPALHAHLLHLVPSCEPVAVDLLDAVDPGVVIVHRSERRCDAASETLERAASRGASTFAIDAIVQGSRPRLEITPELSDQPVLELRGDDDDPVHWSPGED